MTGQPALSFASLLRQLRTEAGLTQEELAEAARVSQRGISDLERGINRTARKDTAGLLADAFDLNDPTRALFVAAARGWADPAQVLAARQDALAALVASTAQNPTKAGAVPIPRELPADVPAFTGREVELAELDLLLPPVRERAGQALGPVVISAVSGTAGVGKTALAARWAHRAAAEFPDGQLYVNLRGYDPDQPVAATDALAGFLRALGVPEAEIPPGETERAARYRTVVTGKRLLVVLDNAAREEQVRPLLPGSPSVMVLVTSRDSLTGLVARDGARRLDLDLLPLPDAVALLTRLIGVRAEADPGAAEALAAQCARLPLALRVAAERAVARPHTSLANLVADLADDQQRLALLDVDNDPRAAVTGVFSWSYRHLPADAARMFRLVGLFPGASWDRHAAAALASVSPSDAARLLAWLCSAHLVREGADGRYEMHDLLRAYATGVARHRDSEAARRAALTRLLNYYLAACGAAMDVQAPAERAHRPTVPPVSSELPHFASHATALEWLDCETPNLVRIAAYAAIHGWPDHAIRLARTLFAGYLEGRQDSDGRALHVAALEAASSAGDLAAQAEILHNLGYIHCRHGDYQDADDCYQKALVLARQRADVHLQCWIHGGRAITAMYCRGDYALAIRYYRQAIGLAQRDSDRQDECVFLGNLAETYLRLGRHRQAARLAERALALARVLGSRAGVAQNLTGLGGTRYGQGRHAEAERLLREGLVIARNIGDRWLEAVALIRLARLYNWHGEHEKAARLCQHAVEINRELGIRDGEGDALIAAAATLSSLGQLDQASQCLAAALALATETGNRYLRADCLEGLGRVNHRRGLYTDASRYYQQALGIYEKVGDRRGQTHALNGNGEALMASAKTEQALARHAAALSLARLTGELAQEVRSHLGIAACYRATGQLDQASEHEDQAASISPDSLIWPHRDSMK